MMFTQKFRDRAAGQEGFTLVELLVVMLILGLLAAIAIPAFFNQRDKARDSDAKAGARSAQTAIETYATDNGGSYASASEASLTAIEPTLTNYSLAVNSDASTYTVTVTSQTGNTFSIARGAGGDIAYNCTEGGKAGCPTGGVWGGTSAGGDGGGGDGGAGGDDD